VVEVERFIELHADDPADKAVVEKLL